MHINIANCSLDAPKVITFDLELYQWDTCGITSPRVPTLPLITKVRLETGHLRKCSTQ